MLEMEFRRGINDEIPAGHNQNILPSICPRTDFTVQRERCFARRTRDKGRAYLALEKHGEVNVKDVPRKDEGVLCS